MWPLFTLPRSFFSSWRYLLVAIPEGLYGDLRKTLGADCSAAGKAILWATLLTGLALWCSSSRPALFPLMLLSVIGACALCVTRRMVKAIPGAAAIGRSQECAHRGKQCQLPIRLRTRFDEIPAPDARSGDSWRNTTCAESTGRSGCRPSRGKNALTKSLWPRTTERSRKPPSGEARRNQLDVRVVPELFGSEPEALELENLAGVPLVKIHHHALPEWTLAVKRIADVVLATAGLIAPVAAAVAGCCRVKLDSRGPVFYRGVRVGRKRRTVLLLQIPHHDSGSRRGQRESKNTQ